MANISVAVGHQTTLLSLAEKRREAIQACTQQSIAAAKPIRKHPALWHPLSDPMTWGEVDSLPPGTLDDTRTVHLWVRFRDPRTRQCMISTGRFNYDGGTWWAQTEFGEDGLVQEVTALARAYIQPGAEWAACLPIFASTVDDLGVED